MLNKQDVKDIRTFLMHLKKSLLKTLADDRGEEKRSSKLESSVFVLDYSQIRVKLDIANSIKNPVFGQGENKGKKLNPHEVAKIVRKYFVKDLKQILPRIQAKQVSSIEEVLMVAARPEEHKSTVFYFNNQELWYYNPTAQGSQKDLFRDVFMDKLQKYAEDLVGRRKYGQLYYFWIKSVHLGHTFGGKATQVAELFDVKEYHSLSEDKDTALLNYNVLGATPNLIQKSTSRKLITLLEIDVDLAVEKNIQAKADSRKSLPAVKMAAEYRMQVAKFEHGAANIKSGSALEAALRKYANKNIQKAIDETVEGISVDHILDILSSKSARQVITKNIEDTFQGKKPKNYKSKTKSKEKIKHKIEQKAKIKKIRLGGTILVEGAGRGMDLNKPYIKDQIINRNLHDQIRKNMGKGNSKQILNYRTGRFAKSVEIERFLPTKEKGAIIALTNFYGFPYTRFADKSDSLWKPGRDIKGIIGRSIRQILQEEKLINLRRVKVDLRG